MARRRPRTARERFAKAESAASREAFANLDRELLPMLERMLEETPKGSPENLFAHRQLAEVLVEEAPWKASLLARVVVAARPKDDRAWAILALAQTLMGHYKYAAEAYRRALEAAPTNPWYAHNLGHLLDVALHHPAEALPHLSVAHASLPHDTEVIASYAHALVEAGYRSRARALLEASASPITDELQDLLAWMDADVDAHSELGATTRKVRRVTVRRPKGYKLAQEALERGLDRLPFRANERQRAVRILKTAFGEMKRLVGKDLSPTLAAAAAAYAAVATTPDFLSCAEVAAPFRVRVADVRSLFSSLATYLPEHGHSGN
ncbi:MAG: hypothetical protein U0174_24010 [Polyangiaceae bacterium]